MNQVFDLNRTIKYANLKLNLNRKMIFMNIGGFLAAMFVISFLVANYAKPTNNDPFLVFHTVGFMAMLFLGCIINAGRAFQDMNTPEKAITQIMIPASTFEKFLVTVVGTSFFWFITTVIGYHTFALISNALWSGVFDLNFTIYNAFDFHNLPNEGVRLIIYYYFSIHAIFYLGASAFRKYPIAKTALSMFVINQGISLIGLLTILVTFGSMTDFGRAMENALPNLKHIESLDELSHYLIIPEIIIFYVIPILFYTAAYFKLKEREV